ncbi:hypothetical protein [Dysgonomonas capnocytophagoides]|jgi:hypothetical protein|uniref:hypothetical protein n=1 Tax=Dysgonomonas capnocytophagoides TaxID=45254 RepID=UPI002A830CA6|nr:hypothetical protein [Dysgonomonas capnocytophagoides]
METEVIYEEVCACEMYDYSEQFTELAVDFDNLLTIEVYVMGFQVVVTVLLLVAIFAVAFTGSHR